MILLKTTQNYTVVFSEPLSLLSSIIWDLSPLSSSPTLDIPSGLRSRYLFRPRSHYYYPPTDLEHHLPGPHMMRPPKRWLTMPEQVGQKLRYRYT